jgi:hypothetical protein
VKRKEEAKISSPWRLDPKKARKKFAPLKKTAG